MHRILQDKSLFRPHCLINRLLCHAPDKSLIEVTNPAHAKLHGHVPNCG